MNWTALLIVGLGVVAVIVGWQGTHNKIANILWGASLTPFGPAGGCPPGFGQGTCGAGQCEIDTVNGRHCIPAVTTGSTTHDTTSISTVPLVTHMI